jgi:hypothetical protein
MLALLAPQKHHSQRLSSPFSILAAKTPQASQHITMAIQHNNAPTLMNFQATLAKERSQHSLTFQNSNNTGPLSTISAQSWSA